MAQSDGVPTFQIIRNDRDKPCCNICGKIFKEPTISPENQAQHEQSKKHQKQLEKLREVAKLRQQSQRMFGWRPKEPTRYFNKMSLALLNELFHCLSFGDLIEMSMISKRINFYVDNYCEVNDALWSEYIHSVMMDQLVPNLS